MFDIPETFKLGGRLWTVEFKDLSITGSTYGATNQAQCSIVLQEGLDDEDLAHTFLHELNHAIAGTMGWTKFNEDEDKIDAHAGLLFQFLQTKKGNLLE